MSILVNVETYVLDEVKEAIAFLEAKKAELEAALTPVVEEVTETAPEVTETVPVEAPAA